MCCLCSLFLLLPDYPEYDGGCVLVQGGAGLLHDGHGVGGDGGHAYHPIRP